MLAERAPHLLNSVSENLKFLEGRPVGIDIDAVTQATYILALKRASQSLGKVILKEHLTTYWELAKIVQKNGISEDKAMDFSKDAWNNYEVYRKAPEMLGIRTLLEVFNEIKVPYLFISSRPIEFEDVTREWFKKRFSWIPGENIILGRKEGVHGGDFKAQTIQEFGVRLHIEDATEEAQIIVQKTGAHVLMVPQPWNRTEIFDHPRIKYLGDFAQVNGSWPVLKFLASREAKQFLS